MEDQNDWLRRMIVKKLLAGSVEKYDEIRSKELGDAADKHERDMDDWRHRGGGPLMGEE
jgi:hypothetical protein